MLMRIVAVCSILIGVTTASNAEPVTTETLLQEMIDLNSLTAFPKPAFETSQFSSYDRRSTRPGAPGWYENSDGFGNEPIPNVHEILEQPNAEGVGRYIIAKVDGPGTVARIWTTLPHPMNGKLTVYLDGSDTPLYDGEAARFMRDFLNCFPESVGANWTGFAQLDGYYFPLPFAKSLRIEWTGKISDLHFYHIVVRRYAPGTDVKSFSPADLKSYRDTIDRVSAILTDSDRWDAEFQPSRTPVDVTVAPDSTSDLFKAEGDSAVTRLELRLDGRDPVLALRQTILQAFFDGATEPQVEMPVGDFFGTFPGIAPYKSLPMTVNADGTMVCRFVMPFTKDAVFRIRNFGNESVHISGSYAVEPRQAGAEPLYFNAKWRVDHEMIAEGGPEARDLSYLVALGQGVYVGSVAYLTNPTNYISGGGSWWGEGDEKIWVDDDSFPSFYGTGSEDYFNYSWSVPTLFTHAYCAQPVCTGPSSRGFTVNTRWHILDPIPFRAHLGFYMELFHHTRTPGLSYARGSYFYATPGTRDDHVKITPADVRQGLELPRDWQPAFMGAENAVFIQAESGFVETRPNVTVEENRGVGASATVVRWIPAPDETFDLTVNVPEGGKYEIGLVNVLTPKSGRYALAIDGGQPLEPVQDLYTPHLTLLRNFHFGVVELTEGQHTLRLIARGKNDASTGTEIGTDVIFLLPR